EHTAQLHREFLEGQAATQHTFQSLLEHQQRLTDAVLGRGIRQDGGSQVASPPPPVAGPITGPCASQAAAIADDRPPESANGSTSLPVCVAASNQTPALDMAEVLRQVVAEKTGYPVE